LSELPKPVEIVDVFRKSEAVPQIVDEAIKVGAKVLWLQEGVLNPLAEERARAAGLLVFSDLCILKEHRRLIKKR
jgi:predicted CoA-binding protein